MKTILVIEDNADAPSGVSINTMRIMTEQELANEADKNSSKASAMMVIIEEVIKEMNLEIAKLKAAKKPPAQKKEAKPCLH